MKKERRVFDMKINYIYISDIFKPVYKFIINLTYFAMNLENLKSLLSYN